MNIESYIPKGRKNAITINQLKIKTGLDNRTIRAEISKARRSNVILNLQDGKGYFRPADDEIGLVQRWYRQELHRLKEQREILLTAAYTLNEGGR